MVTLPGKKKYIGRSNVVAVLTRWPLGGVPLFCHLLGCCCTRSTVHSHFRVREHTPSSMHRSHYDLVLQSEILSL